MSSDAHDRRGNVARRLGGQTLYILAGNFYTLAVGLPLQIFVSRVLGASGLGVFGLLEAGVNTLTPFLGFGISQTAVRFLPVHLERKEHGRARRLVRLGLFLLLATSILACGAVLCAMPWIIATWPELAAHRYALLMMALMIPLSSVVFFLQQSLRGFQDIRYMVLGSSVVQLTVKAALTVAAFAVGYRIEGYVFATVAATFVSLLWMGYGLQRRLRLLPQSLEDARGSEGEWRRYAGVIYTGSLLNASVAQSSLERILLGIFFGPAAVGILIVVRQLQVLPGVFNQMLLTVGAPMIAAAHARDDLAERKHLYALMTDWVVRASLPLVLFLLIFAQPALLLFGPEFAEGGTDALRILLLGLMVNIASGPTGNVALMCGLERAHLNFSIVSTILRTLLLLGLTPLFGLVGVAAAFAAEFVWSAVYTVYLIRARLGMTWWDRRFLRWLFPGLASASAGLALLLSGIAIGPLVLALALFGMYAVFVGASLLQGLHADDRELLQDIRAQVSESA